MPPATRPECRRSEGVIRCVVLFQHKQARLECVMETEVVTVQSHEAALAKVLLNSYR